MALILGSILYQRLIFSRSDKHGYQQLYTRKYDNLHESIKTLIMSVYELRVFVGPRRVHSFHSLVQLYIYFI